MIKILTILVIMLLFAIPVTATNVTKVEIHGLVFDQTSPTYNTTLAWNAQNFAGFWYVLGSGKSSEYLTIDQPGTSLTNASRIIEKGKLLYNTSRTDQKYVVFGEINKTIEKGLEYNSTTKTFTKSITGGYYARLGWFGDVYVAVNGKANKLAKLVKEQKKDEKQTLKPGATWELGEGYNLTVESIDTKTSPRQAWLSFSKNGTILDNRVVREGEVYTYTEKSLNGESDVPIFVTYVESIFTGAEDTSVFIQLKYTWLVSPNILEIKTGDKFGIFEVKEANSDYLLFYNKDKSISLDQNSVQPLYKNISLKVADIATALRFYPIAEKTSSGIYEIRGGAYDQDKSKDLIWDAQRFPGFWYVLGSGKSSENLAVDQDASSLTNVSRVIEREKLLYSTSRTDQKYVVFGEKNKTIENGLEYNSTTKTFTKSITGGYYARLGWFGDVYVAVNGKANKLAKLIMEQKKYEKQTLKLGTTWELGEGYNLTVESIDTKTSPRQAWLSFSKNGTILDNRVVREGEVYTYTEKSLSGESDVPVFVTYVESVFTGAEGTATFVQFRYTWLISQDVLEIKTGDKFGVLEVKEANEGFIRLYNKDKTISLDQNTVVDLAGGIKFKIADSSTALRFYPFIEYIIQGPSETELKAASAVTATTTIPATATVLATTQTTTATSAPASVQAVAPDIIQTAVPIKAAIGDIPANAPASVPKQPGFEALYAIVGLIMTGYLVLRRG